MSAEELRDHSELTARSSGARARMYARAAIVRAEGDIAEAAFWIWKQLEDSTAKSELRQLLIGDRDLNERTVFKIMFRLMSTVMVEDLRELNGEPMFVLKGRDEVAPMAVRGWATAAKVLGTPSEKIDAAFAIANLMENYPNRKLPD